MAGHQRAGVEGSRFFRIRLAAGVASGVVCAECRGQCVDCPSGLEPLLVQCVACAGDEEKCEKCKGTGSIEVTQCPQNLITPDVVELFDAAFFAKRGTWPVGGGLLDQTTCCVAGVRRVWSEVEYWEMKASSRS